MQKLHECVTLVFTTKYICIFKGGKIYLLHYLTRCYSYHLCSHHKNGHIDKYNAVMLSMPLHNLIFQYIIFNLETSLRQTHLHLVFWEYLILIVSKIHRNI